MILKEAPLACTLNAGDEFHATDASERTCGCNDTGCEGASDDRARVARRAIGGTAAIAATGAIACGVCCVLPFALPAAALAVAGGGILSWFAKAAPWAMTIASLAVVCSWVWVAYESIRSGQAPARSTYLTLGASTIVFAVAATWWYC